MQQDERKSDMGTPLVRPRIQSTKKEAMQELECGNQNLKLEFANKLYDKNFGASSKYVNEKDFIIQNIIQDCIILLPKHSMDYSIGFYSFRFDQTCVVKGVYNDSARFTYFIDANGNKIDIYN